MAAAEVLLVLLGRQVLLVVDLLDLKVFPVLLGFEDPLVLLVLLVSALLVLLVQLDLLVLLGLRVLLVLALLVPLVPVGLKVIPDLLVAPQVPQVP